MNKKIFVSNYESFKLDSDGELKIFIDNLLLINEEGGDSLLYRMWERK